MAEYTYDLHFHSCLSPCGSDDQTPGVLAGLCAVTGIDIAALTDHNTCRNCEAFLKAAEYYGLLGIPGMELTTSEEVHVVCLFKTLEKAMAFSGYVEGHLPPVKNKPRIFGNQRIMDADDNCLGETDIFLAGATDISIYDVVGLMRVYDGFAYPAHIDRPSNSLLSNLGLWDDSMGFTMFELSRNADLSDAAQMAQFPDLPFIVCSDAHYMNQIMEPHQRIELKEKTASCLIDTMRTFGK